MQSISAFVDKAIFIGFWSKNADVSRAQGFCHTIHIFFGPYLVKL